MIGKLLIGLATGVIVAAAVVGCSGGEQSASDARPSPTFSDGLTAQDILERAREAGESIRSVRIDWTDHSEFLGEPSESATETITVDDDLYVKVADEDGVSELLHYGGRWYTRSSSRALWEPDPALEGMSAQVPGLKQAVEEVLSGPSFFISRLDDAVVDSQKFFRVHAEFASRTTDVHAILEDLAGEDGDTPPLPEELLPDEVSVTLDFWIGADDLMLHRWEQFSALYKDGNPISSGRRAAEASSFNGQLELPGPLPDG